MSLENQSFKELLITEFSNNEQQEISIEYLSFISSIFAETSYVINFAAQYHKKQVIPGTKITYVNHLYQVMNNAIVHMIADIIENINNKRLILKRLNPDIFLKVIKTTILHDILEDTDCNEDELKNEFGTEILMYVKALTKDKEFKGIEAMQDSIYRIILCNNPIPAIVKLADRLYNISLTPPESWSQEKITNYITETNFIINHLGKYSNSLKNKLQYTLEQYIINNKYLSVEMPYATEK